MPKLLKGFIKVAVIILIAYLVFVKILNVPEIIMKKLYPKSYSEYVVKYSEEYGVDPLLVYAVIKAESNFDNNVVSNSNAKGLMQLMDATADEVAEDVITDETFETDMLFDAETNIKIGTKYLSELLEKYDGNYYLATAAYNAGIGTVDKWIEEGIIKPDGSDIENIPYKETNNYVRKIIRDYGIYERLY